MSTAQIRAIEDYNRLLHRNAIAHAIRAGVDLGVLRALETGQKTLVELADELDLQPEPLQLLLNVLCQTELLEKYDEDYALSTVARLIPKSVQDLGDRYWQYLTGVVRTGNRLPTDADVPVSERDYLIDSAAAEWTHTPVAMDVAEALEIGSSRRQLRILELACGAAVFGAAMAHRDPESQLVLVDETEPLKRARDTIDGVQLQNRTRYVTADYRSPELIDLLQGETFDLLLLAGVLNRHTSEGVRELLERIRPLLPSGGEIAIVDIFPGQERGDRYRAILELELFLRTTSGKLHSPREIENVLRELGFEKIEYAHLPSAPHVWGLVVARKI